MLIFDLDPDFVRNVLGSYFNLIIAGIFVALATGANGIRWRPSHMEPVLLKGGETVKSLSTNFLADLEEDWRHHGKEIFPVLREKYPQAYFQGIVSLARIIRWDVDPTGAFNRRLSPEEIMNKLEERVGPEGRKLFEQFLRKVNKLQAQQQLEAQASRERGPG